MPIAIMVSLRDAGEDLAAACLHGVDPRAPMASPLRADLRGPPPLAETLLDGAVRLAGAAGAADVAVMLDADPDMIHVWPLFHRGVAAGRLVREAGR